MLNEQELERYRRQIRLAQWGEKAQLKLKKAKVLVIGAGGLGSPVLLYLAAAGVGKIGIVDFDKVDLSNLQRQVLYQSKDKGQLKAKCAASKLKALNPHIQVDAYEQPYAVGNAVEISREYDLLVDGSDNFETRYLVNDVCVYLDKPFVSAAIEGFQGQLSVFNYKGGPTYRCLFPEAPENQPGCEENGVIGSLPGVLGCMQATEVLKIVGETGRVLSGELLQINLLENRFQTFRFQANPDSRKISQKRMHAFIEKDTPDIRFLSRSEYMQKFFREDHQLIDVSSDMHEPMVSSAVHVPIYELENELPAKDKPVVVYCQNGITSKQAALILQNKGYQHIFCII